MFKKLLCLTFFAMAFMAAPVGADTLSGLEDITVVDGAIISLRYAGTEYVVADGDLTLGTTTRWYIPGSGVETLWVDGTPIPPATVSGTSGVKGGDIGPKADNFLFTLNGSNNISSIDGIDFQQTIFPFLTNVFFHFERGGNDTGTWQAILEDGSLGEPVAFRAANDYADTGVNVNGQNAWGVVFTTDVPVQGVRITASGHDTFSISTPTPSPILAAILSPPDGATDVRRDVILSWLPGEFADSHNVYLGTAFAEVDGADIGSPLLVSPSQKATAYDASLLDFGQTYYWRIDEVNAPATPGIFKGEIWSFATEPFAYPIEDIIATASSSAPDQGHENTVNGSGLDDSGLLHGNASAGTMWLSNPTGVQPSWVAYEFDQVFKLHQMQVWNYNESWEPMIGVGVKDATIEYSVDGVDYTTLGTTHEFAQGPGTADYAHNTTVDLGVMAKYVRLTANSNWGGDILKQYGLSEVNISYVPLVAREPSPASGATDVDVDVILGWRTGREAASHDVYVGTEPDALALAGSVAGPSFDPASLALGQSYYWRVDEVNDAETPTTWQGDLWSFSTQEFLVVEDFESYNDIVIGEEGSNLVYLTWIDGFDNPTTNGSAMGYTVPFEPTMETDTVHGGDQSAPMEYNNTTAAFSEVARTLAPQNWTANGVQVLSLWFFGDPANMPGQLYVKINGVKVNYNGDSGNLRRSLWQVWNIDLASVAGNLQSVTSLAVGIDGSGVTGTLLLDDIRLYQSAPGTAKEIWLEAEAAVSITAPMKTYLDPLASGGTYIGTDAGIGDEANNPPANGVATYSFTAEAGIYKITFRVSIIGVSNSFWVRIPGATAYDPGTHASGWINFNGISDGAAWHWDDVHSDNHGQAVVKITLPAGQHTLEVAHREGGALLDAILITDDVD